MEIFGFKNSEERDIYNGKINSILDILKGLSYSDIDGILDSVNCTVNDNRDANVF